MKSVLVETDACVVRSLDLKSIRVWRRRWITCRCLEEIQELADLIDVAWQSLLRVS